MGRLLLNCVLSDPYVDVALVRGRVPRGTGRASASRGLCRGARHGHPEISDDVASRIDLLTTGDLQIAYDDRIASEYRQVLARPRFGFQPEAVAHLLEYLFAAGLPIVARPLPATLPDPDDQPFWEVAVEAAAPLTTAT